MALGKWKLERSCLLQRDPKRKAKGNGSNRNLDRALQTARTVLRACTSVGWLRHRMAEPITGVPAQSARAVARDPSRSRVERVKELKLQRYIRPALLVNLLMPTVKCE